MSRLQQWVARGIFPRPQINVACFVRWTRKQVDEWVEAGGKVGDTPRPGEVTTGPGWLNPGHKKSGTSARFKAGVPSRPALPPSPDVTLPPGCLSLTGGSRA
jgi:hypothetical protein